MNVKAYLRRVGPATTARLVRQEGDTVVYTIDGTSENRMSIEMWLKLPIA